MTFEPLVRRLLPRTGGLPRAFWLLWVGLVVNRAGSFVQPFLALYLVGERGLSVEGAGGIVALVGAGSLSSGPLGGTMADRLGRRPALALATALDAVAMASLGLSRAPLAIGVAAFGVGLFGELYRPPAMAMVADLVPAEDRPRAYGLVYWGANLGFAIALTVSGAVASASYAALFAGDAAAALLFGALVVLRVGETRPPSGPEQRPGAGLLAPYRHPAFLAFGGVSLLLAIAFHQTGSTLPLDMSAHGIGPRTFGVLMGMNGVLIVLLQPFGNTLVASARRGRVLAFGAALTGVGFGACAFASVRPVPVYAASIVVWTLGEIAMSGISPTVVADFAPPHLRGSYQGAFQLSWGLSTLLAPLAGSAVLQRAGAATLWGGVLVVCLLAAALYLRVVPDRR